MSPEWEYRPLEGLPVPALVVRGTDILFANAALSRLLGLEREEVLKAPLAAWVARCLPSERDWVEALQRPSHETPSPEGVWTRMRVAGGEERTVCLQRGPGVRSEEVVVLVLDAENLLARQAGGAQEGVKSPRLESSRCAELTRQQAERVEQERLTVLGEAARVVAHEVRNPLGVIHNATAILKREGRLGPAGSSAVELLQEEVTRLESLVNDLLDVVRPMEPKPWPVQLGELAQRVLKGLPPGDVRPSLHEEAGLPVIQADEQLLQMAVEKLVRNAVENSPPRGKVHVKLARAEEGVVVRVEDEGAGLAPAEAQRAFEPFFTTRTNGTGLGLALVKRVVGAHGGRVTASQRAGGGACFELWLPLRPPWLAE